MEFLLVLGIAVLILKPEDVQQLVKCAAKLLHWRQIWQQKSHNALHRLTQTTSTNSTSHHDAQQ